MEKTILKITKGDKGELSLEFDDENMNYAALAVLKTMMVSPGFAGIIIASTEKFNDIMNEGSISKAQC